MSDIGTLIDYPQTVITPASLNSLGAGVRPFGITWIAAAAWPSSNLAFFVPFTVGAPIIAQKMFWENGATVGTNTVDVGIYDSQGNRLVSLGATTTSGVSSIQTAAITPTTLETGLYYMAMVMNGTTDTVWRTAPSFTTLGRILGVLSQTTASPLPATATMVGSTTAYIPFIGITSNTVI